MFFAEGLDLHIHARRQIELHQGVDRLLRRLENIEQALVGADLELLPRLLVHVRRTQHAVLILHRGQGDRPRDLRARALRGLDNLTSFESRFLPLLELSQSCTKLNSTMAPRAINLNLLDAPRINATQSP